MELDNYDLRLLRALQKNTRQTQQQLARVVHLSPSSVRRRLARLRRCGAIRAEMAIIDPAILGAKITVLALISFVRESQRIYREFRRRMLADNHVLQCYSIAGQYDFALIVAAENPSAYEDWSQQALLGDGNIKRFDSFVVWSTVKCDWQPAVTVPATDRNS